MYIASPRTEGEYQSVSFRKGKKKKADYTAKLEKPEQMGRPKNEA